jgi:hypothetical protein
MENIMKIELTDDEATALSLLEDAKLVHYTDFEALWDAAQSRTAAALPFEHGYFLQAAATKVAKAVWAEVKRITDENLGYANLAITVAPTMGTGEYREARRLLSERIADARDDALDDISGIEVALQFISIGAMVALQPGDDPVPARYRRAYDLLKQAREALNDAADEAAHDAYLELPL